MYVLEDKNFGYIAHPKTASSATSRIVRDTFGAKQVGNHHAAKEEWCRPILDSGGIIMATIRNPYDLMVSWYFHYAARRPGTPMEPFTEWLPNIIKKPNGYIEQGIFFGLKWANRILRFEHLQEDFDLLCDEVGLPRTFIESFNVSAERKGRPYQEMYDSELRQLIQQNFSDELNVGDYSFEE